jgi:hypothetical protein
MLELNQSTFIWLYSIGGRIALTLILLFGLYLLVNGGEDKIQESILKVFAALILSIIVAGCIATFFM